jgi:hypothetical protein
MLISLLMDACSLVSVHMPGVTSRRLLNTLSVGPRGPVVTRGKGDAPERDKFVTIFR